MKNEIKFTAHFGDEIKNVKLTIPSGLPVPMWYVYVNDYYYGRIQKQNGLWVSVDLKEFSNEDVAAMGKRIDAGK